MVDSSPGAVAKWYASMYSDYAHFAARLEALARDLLADAGIDYISD